MTDFAAMTKRVDQNLAAASHVVTLDVGGTIFKTSKPTLLRVEGSYFHALLGSGLWKPDGPEETYFLDLDPDIFRHVLKLFRTGVVLEWEGLSKGDCHAFMTMLEYLGLNNVGLQSFEWALAPRAYSRSMTLSNASRTVQAEYGHAVARSTSLLVGSCLILVEDYKDIRFEDGRRHDKFAIGVGPAEVSEPSRGGDEQLRCFLYRCSGEVKTPVSETVYPVRGLDDHRALCRGDVVTVRRGPSNLAFSVNDEEPIHVFGVDASVALYPVAFLFQSGTRLTLLD